MGAGSGPNRANEDEGLIREAEIFNKRTSEAKWWEIDVEEDSNASRSRLSELQPNVQRLTRPFF